MISANNLFFFRVNNRVYAVDASTQKVFTVNLDYTLGSVVPPHPVYSAVHKASQLLLA